MEAKAQSMYSVTADFTYIEIALKSRWEPFQKLAAEFAETREDYVDARLGARPIARPESGRARRRTPRLGRWPDRCCPGARPTAGNAVCDPVMAEYVTVAFVSHALCEAMINAILAIGLAMEGAAEVFPAPRESRHLRKMAVGAESHRPLVHPE